MDKDQIKELIIKHKVMVNTYEDIKKDSIKFWGEKINKIEGELNEARKTLNEKIEKENRKIRLENFYVKILEEEVKRYEEYFRDDEGDNERIMKEKIDKKIKECGTIFFKGCDNCDQWDGISKRCNCGNRRVGWIWTDNDDDIEPEVY